MGKKEGSRPMELWGIRHEHYPCKASTRLARDTDELYFFNFINEGLRSVYYINKSFTLSRRKGDKCPFLKR